MVHLALELEKAKKAFFLIIPATVIIYSFHSQQPLFTFNALTTKNYWIRPHIGLDEPRSSRNVSQQSLSNSDACQKEYEGFTIHKRSDQSQSPNAKSAICIRKQIKPTNTCEAMKDRIWTLVDKCDSFKEIQLCSIQQTTSKDYTFNCSMARLACNSLFFGFYNLTRSFNWQWHLLQNSTYEQELNSFAESVETGIIKCHLKSYWSVLFKSFKMIGRWMKFVEQIVWFLKKPKPLPSVKKAPFGPSISIIFLDGFSRSILYRSLPETVDFMRNLNSLGTRKVLDFKLFQSIAEKTYWHLSNLFDGPVADIKDRTDSYYYKKSQKFFRRFNEQGYLTGLSYDLCYQYTWRGPNLDNKNNKLKSFKKVLDDLNLDNFGLSLVLCEFAQTYIRSTNMFGQYGKCFNGRRFMDYQLDYMDQVQQNWLSEGRKFVTFVETNSKHCSEIAGGKFLDESLKRHLQLITKNPNTMVVLVSDHGHKYGNWVERQAPESRTDMFHPFLFILLPERERRFFSESELTNMWTNQNRLLTMRDLHFLFAKFWGGHNETTNGSTTAKEYNGILSKIPFDRTCSNLTYSIGFAATHCICEQVSTKLSDEETEEVIQFVNKELNRLLEKSFNTSDALRNTCRTIDLKLSSDTGLEKYESTDKQVAISVLLQQRQFVYKKSKVVFSVTVEKTFKRDNIPYKLDSFHRTDKYSRFEDCIPKDFPEPKLCLCNKKSRKKKKN